MPENFHKSQMKIKLPKFLRKLSKKFKDPEDQFSERDVKDQVRHKAKNELFFPSYNLH